MVADSESVQTPVAVVCPRTRVSYSSLNWHTVEAAFEILYPQVVVEVEVG